MQRHPPIQHIVDRGDRHLGHAGPRAYRRRGDVRQHDAVGEREQGVVGRNRLYGGNVQAGSRDRAICESPRQRLLIHDSASRRVDQNRLWFHPVQFPLSDEPTRLCVQADMQGDDVRAFQQFIEGNLLEWQVRHAVA